jgi:hypothetical protein
MWILCWYIKYVLNIHIPRYLKYRIQRQSIEKYNKAPANYMINMSYIDDVFKWLKSPKTLKGLAGMAFIIIILALDFAWWAGQDLTTNVRAASDEEVVEEEPWQYELAVDDTYTGTLLLPSGGQVKNPGVTVAYHDVEVPENSTLGFFNVSVSGNALRPDFDLRVYGPDGELVDQAATEAADETLKIEFKVFNRTGAGTWRVEVDNYSSINIGYSLTIQIHIRAPIEENEEER